MDNLWGGTVSVYLCVNGGCLFVGDEWWVFSCRG